MSFRTIHRMSA